MMKWPNTFKYPMEDTLRRYIKSTLEPEEEQALEEFMMDKPELLRELEVMTLMMEASRDVMVAPSSSGKPRWLKQWLTPVTIGLCASTFAVGLMVGVIGFNQISGVNVPSHALDIVYLSAVRGTVDTPSATLQLSDNLDQYILVLQNEGTTKGSYQLTIVAESSETLLFKASALKSNPLGDIYAAVPADCLSPGRLHVRLSLEGVGIVSDTILQVDH